MAHANTGAKDRTLAWMFGIGFGLIAIALLLALILRKPAEDSFVDKQRDQERAQQRKEKSDRLVPTVAPASGEKPCPPAVTTSSVLWEPQELTPAIRLARPQSVQGSDEVVAWLMLVGDYTQLKFSFPGERTGWIFHPDASTIKPSVGAGEGVKPEIAPGHGEVPGEWVRWQKLPGSQSAGVYVTLTDLGKNRLQVKRVQ